MSDFVKRRRKTEQPSWAFASMLLFMLIYFALVIACLWQWRTPHPLSRINFYSASALILSGLLGWQQLRFSRALPQKEDVQREAFGMNYDPAMAKWIAFLACAELAVFLDYGHWHLVPTLENQFLQSIGLVLYIASLLWLRWVDASLAAHFNSAGAKRQILNSGAFHYIRHPRYAGLLISRMASALVFASLIGWILFLGWFLIVRRRIILEELHLQELFGEEYELYKQHSARLLPHFY